MDTAAGHSGSVTTNDVPTAEQVVLPERLDDEWVRSSGDALRAVAHAAVGPELQLDASSVQVVSTRALGLLTAVRLIAARRRTEVVAVGCAPSPAAALGLARIRVQPAAGSSVPEQAASVERHD